MTAEGLLLGRDQILAADDLVYEDVEVPEWGGSVRVRTLTGQERDDYESHMVRRRGRQFDMNLANARAGLVARVLVDAEGNRLFGDGDEAAVKALGRKSAKALDRVFDVARRLSGLSEADIEELAEGLEETPGVASPSI